jgi:hypothetical protein
MVAFHVARKTAALRRAHHIHTLTQLEEFHRQLLALGVAFIGLDPQLAQVLHSRNFPGQRLALGVLLVGLQQTQVTALCLRQTRRLLRRFKAELNGRIAIVLDRADLRHVARPGFDHSDRHGFAARRENLGHAQLTTN